MAPTAKKRKTSPSSSASLTSHLLALDQAELERATSHPFLSAAGTSTLPKEKLQHWLAQDRLYALSYVNFIGSLLSQISIPTGKERESSLKWRVVDILIDALQNIRREVGMFEAVAEAEGLVVCTSHDGREVEPERATRCYQDLFCGATGMGRSGLVALVVLWATEECYLRSWKFAAETSREVKKDGEGDVMQRTLIPNWTSSEFEAFVGRLRELVDEWAALEGEDVWRECERAWRQVVWCEGEFWPEV